MPERVQVIYFPKRTRDSRRPTRETPAPEPRETLEFRPEIPEGEPVTEKVEAPVKNRRAPATARNGKGKRRRPSLELDTDPALRYHVQKLEEMLDSGSPAERLRGLSRRELAEIAMFGHQLFEAGRLEEARVVFEGLVGLDLEDAFPHTMLGTVFLALGAQDRAMALFEAALSIDPADLAARVYRAEIRINQGKLQPAKQDLERALRDGPVDDPFVERAHRLKKILSDRQ
ncbi:MAG: tetratricopeptide repeat protein [Myxococcaceae bacterium]